MTDRFCVAALSLDGNARPVVVGDAAVNIFDNFDEADRLRAEILKAGAADPGWFFLTIINLNDVRLVGVVRI